MRGHRLSGVDHQSRLHCGADPAARWAKRIAMMAAVALFAAPEPANAQYFWNWGPADATQVQPKRPRVKIKRKVDPAEIAAKNAPKPQGPLVIAISVAKQRVKVYDSNGLYAEAPVSTGTKTHPTPMGVFSIIQKNRHHVSNLYGAQMPYMQRITWSGVAMHTGPLPGYAASHGCVRLPNDFAARLWTWTRMGTRVIVAPDDVTPTDISHPKLIARMTPPPTVSLAPVAPAAAVAATSDKAERAANAQLRTADAREAIAGMKGTLSDASPGAPGKTETLIAEAKPVELKNGGIDSAGDPPEATIDAQASPNDAPNTSEIQETMESKPQPVETAAPATDTKPADTAAPPAAETAKPVLASPAPQRRHNHVAVFISRKDRKLYVRHGYEPVFDVPVEIVDSGRPLGTHVFTARGDKDDVNALRWSAVSLPQVMRTSVTSNSSRRSTKGSTAPAQTVVLPPASTATEALERITIPAEALERIAAVLTPGGSLLISDQPLGWETGKGTDFIVPLR